MLSGQKKSSAPHATRSLSSSTHSCLTVGDEAEDTPSLTMSSTPPTVNTDSSSLNDALDNEANGPRFNRFSRIRRKPVPTYNAKGLAGTVKRKREALESVHRNISGATLVNDLACKSVEDLLGASIKSLNMEWAVDALPGPKARGEVKSETPVPKRRSTRLDFREKAKNGLSERLSMLGKQGRNVIGSSKEATSSTLLGIKRRASLRPRELEKKTEMSTGPPAKKLRFSENSDLSAEKSQELEKPPKAEPVRKEKLWLKQGLYVGQNRHFDGRFSESRNKAKAEAKLKELQKERKILPLPMFRGQHLLEKGRDFKLPFDVFSPLPPGQPKPDEWKKCQKNVFIGDAASYWKDIVLQESSRCICEVSSGCGENCLNRFMLYECDNSNCNIGAEACTNRSFADLKERCKLGGKYRIGVEVIRTKNKGYGVRSNRTFAPGQIIVEYAGEIITQEECEDRMNQRYKDNECYYLMLFDQNMIIDATRGSIARFINHSCEPNCKMVKWIVAGKPRMALFAGDKGISTGEELTYDYKFEAYSIKNDQECHCGSTLCRGFLGGKPKEAIKDPKVVLDSLAKGTKRRRDTASSIEMSTTATKKRKVDAPKAAKLVAKSAKAGATRRVAQLKASSSRRVQVFKAKKTTITTQSYDRASKLKRVATRAISTSKTRKSIMSDAEESSQRASTSRVTVSTVKRNVVRTVRGSRRAAAGRLRNMRAVDGSTIRVVAE